MANREEKNQFSMMIMQRASETGTDNMDAITAYCEENNLEVEMAATLINDSLKGMIQNEAIKLRYLPKVNMLPF